VTDDWRLAINDCQQFLQDAAHFPGGHAAGVVFPRNPEEVADVLRSAESILPIGAQSSLTGGATPMGELIVATSKMSRILRLAPERIVVEAGVTVAAMQEQLATVGAWFPPAPTFTGACAGGIVATNAAGAATFKYGSTRDWVEALTVVLADGTVLSLDRATRRSADGPIEIETRSGRVRIPLPSYRMPQVIKCSAGYYSAPGMDLIDLFIGSEGTLGVITQVTFRTLAPAPVVALAFIPCRSEPQALTLVGELRRASQATWRTADRDGIDISAIEHIDRRSLQLLRDDGALRRHHVNLPDGAELALLVQLEFRPGLDHSTALDQIQSALGAEAADTPLVRFCRLLESAGVLADTEVVLPGDRRRAEDFVAIREAVPAAVNQRVGIAKRDVDPRIEKTAADMIVPFERFGEMMSAYRTGFEAEGLDYAVWGHISDGNVHPNVIPRSFDDVLKGKKAILDFGRNVARLGGCPLAEHGVGRNPVKHALLQQLYGESGIEQMRAVKRALDPQWKLAPGVIFPKSAVLL
jgi:D-lactate dehydrogenase (cytochrome)